MAGGPPHRAELLEPVSLELVKADWAGYSRVVAELTRGIQLTTGLRTQLNQALGWIGVECHSEAMAIWLVRAIVVENVSVRREGDLLYLPASPKFRLEAVDVLEFRITTAGNTGTSESTTSRAFA